MGWQQLIKNTIVLSLEKIIVFYKANLWPFIFHSFKLNNFHLEIHVTDHCNLNCKGCSHYSPILEERLIDIDGLNDDLNSIFKLSNCFSQIRILGGEPLLHPELHKILELVRKYFKRQEILIVTNGVLLLNMNDFFWNAIRDNNIIISMTVYPNINYDKINALLRGKEVPFQFYGQRNGKNNWLSFNLKESGENSLSNFYKCGGHQFCWQLRNGKIFSCPICAYSEILNKRFGTNFRIKKNDFIDLKSCTSKLRLRLFSLLPKPFCRYCKLPRKLETWQFSKYDKNEWVS